MTVLLSQVKGGVSDDSRKLKSLDRSLNLSAASSELNDSVSRIDKASYGNYQQMIFTGCINSCIYIQSIVWNLIFSIKRKKNFLVLFYYCCIRFNSSVNGQLMYLKCSFLPYRSPACFSEIVIHLETTWIVPGVFLLPVGANTTTCSNFCRLELIAHNFITKKMLLKGGFFFFFYKLCRTKLKTQSFHYL